MHLATNNDSEDILVAKVDPCGLFAWAKAAGGGGSADEGTGIGVGANGAVYVTGTYGTPANFDQMVVQAPPGENTTDDFVWKLAP
jgi:hypothetical protein